MGRPTLNRTCDIEGCIRRHCGRGLCRMHLRRLLRHGDPQTTKKAANGEALQFFNNVVASYRGDSCLIWPFGKDRHGYGRLMIAGRSRSVARMACEEANGPTPEPGLDAAHSCGWGHMGCVAPSHLRWATRKENMADARLHGTIMGGRGKRAEPYYGPSYSGGGLY